jgi:CYTH domain-containing protein
VLKADGLMLSANRGSQPLTYVSLNHYSEIMIKAVQAGQVWRSDENGDNFLVTKVYGELFTQYAMLRPAKVSAPDAETVRVKITKDANGMTLPGYTFTQDSQDF